MIILSLLFTFYSNMYDCFIGNMNVYFSIEINSVGLNKAVERETFERILKITINTCIC